MIHTCNLNAAQHPCNFLYLCTHRDYTVTMVTYNHNKYIYNKSLTNNQALMLFCNATSFAKLPHVRMSVKRIIKCWPSTIVDEPFETLEWQEQTLNERLPRSGHKRPGHGLVRSAALAQLRVLFYILHFPFAYHAEIIIIIIIQTK